MDFFANHPVFAAIGISLAPCCHFKRKQKGEDKSQGQGTRRYYSDMKCSILEQTEVSSVGKNNACFCSFLLSNQNKAGGKNIVDREKTWMMKQG